MALQKYNKNIIQIYLPCAEDKEKIKKDAKAKKTTLSKYIVSRLEAASSQEMSRPSSGQDLNKLQEENRRLALELHESEHRIARLEGDLRKVRHEELLKPEGTGEIDPNLLSIIRAGPIHDYRLLAALGVEPGSETSRGVAKQLQILETTGFISRTSQGWRWNK
jgi:predicted RNase H-like nuclease (RuvC/YqgF family)